MLSMKNEDLQMLLFLVGMLPVDAQPTVDRYKRSPDRVLKAEDVHWNYTYPTASSCLSRCSSLGGCSGVSWNPQNFACWLSKYRLEHESGLFSHTDIEHQWISYGRMLVRVWMVRGPGNMRLDDARRECAVQRGRLATGEELLEARAAGLNMCSIGWMDDGSMGFVLQAPKYHCYPLFSTGIIYSNRSTANAWCIDDL